MKIKLLSIILILISLTLFSIDTAQTQGIIIADNDKIIDIFKNHQSEATMNLVNNLNEYDRIILHLGAKYVFKRGSAFFYRTSKENLQLFCNQLKTQNKKVYLWFLDSFSGNGFAHIYKEYKEIIDDNYNQIEKLNLNYDGIVIDLEWINLHSKDNSDEYLEILAYLRDKFKNKEIYSFISIIDNKQENLKRGYNEEKILYYVDNIIPMLYIKDGGFYLQEDRLNLYLNTRRIEDLREYYQQNNYEVTISLQGGIILERNNSLYFIQTNNQFKYTDHIKKDYTQKKKYYTITSYTPKESFELLRDDGLLEVITQNDRLYFLEINKNNLARKEDYIWEYFINKK